MAWILAWMAQIPHQQPAPAASQPETCSCTVTTWVLRICFENASPSEDLSKPSRSIIEAISKSQMLFDFLQNNGLHKIGWKLEAKQSFLEAKVNCFTFTGKRNRSYNALIEALHFYFTKSQAKAKHPSLCFAFRAKQCRCWYWCWC
jgi:hypothetical protein